MTVDVAVYRTPALDGPPAWASYAVDLPERATVLDALISIRAEQDSTLAFRSECRSGICGACAGLVNGRPSLFCQTLITDALALPGLLGSGAPLAIEPLPPFQVLKDLVVDVDGFFEAFRIAHTWIEPAEMYSGLLPPTVAEQLADAASCILCGLCVDGAPPAVANPAVAARLLRISRDPRDAHGVERLARLGPADPRRHADALAAHLAACCPAGVEVRRLAAAEPNGTGTAAPARAGASPDDPRDA